MQDFLLFLPFLWQITGHILSIHRIRVIAGLSKEGVNNLVRVGKSAPSLLSVWTQPIKDSIPSQTQDLEP